MQINCLLIMPCVVYMHNHRMLTTFNVGWNGHNSHSDNCTTVLHISDLEYGHTEFVSHSCVWLLLAIPINRTMRIKFRFNQGVTSAICIIMYKIIHMTWKDDCGHVIKRKAWHFQIHTYTARRCQGYTKKMENTLVWGDNTCSKPPIHPTITALGLSEFSPSLLRVSPASPEPPYTHPASQPPLWWRRQAVLGLSRLAKHHCAAEEFVMQGTQAIHTLVLPLSHCLSPTLSQSLPLYALPSG